jgi:hypothetical protein
MGCFIKLKSARVQKFKNSRVQGLKKFKGSRVQGFRGSKVQGFKGSCFVPRSDRFKSSRVTASFLAVTISKDYFLFSILYFLIVQGFKGSMLQDVKTQSKTRLRLAPPGFGVTCLLKGSKLLNIFFV